MPDNAMVNLYYTNKEECRQDCDTLGIDRRRVKSADRYWNTRDMTTWTMIDGQMQEAPVVAWLRVRPDLVSEHRDKLQHDDDETTW